MPDGDCFVVTGDVFLADGDADVETLTLCHGKPIRRNQPQQRRYWHAWIETADEIAIDRSNDDEVRMSCEAYYLLGRIVAEDVRRYNATDARRNLLFHGTYGPWSSEP